MPMRRPQAQRTPQGTSPTATRPWAYLPHCHSPLSVPPRTFTAEWQCEPHFHSALGAPSALPLAP